MIKRPPAVGRLLAVVAALSFTVTGALGQTNQATPDDVRAALPTYTPAPANLAARSAFQDSKFGIFLHWGIYSELGGVALDSGLPAEWIMEHHKISIKHYERLARFFNPTQFDADAWVRTFKDAGAGYIVITAKHHDGFAMFDSQVSDYDIVGRTPFARDPMKELAAACREHGLKLFFYYSQLDWHHPDYYPRGYTGHHAGRPHQGDWERYLAFQDAQIAELLTNYGPIGGIWLDGGFWDQEATRPSNNWRLDRTYAMIHRLQPGAMIVNNHHLAPFPGEDYQVFERDLPGENTKGYNTAAASDALPLEMAETMNGSWGFSLTDDRHKSTATLVRTMVGAAGRGANFLLNTGPMPNGELQPENVATLGEIGAWLKVYGRSIYGTRKGPMAPRPWGVTTQAGNRVYVHVLDWADDRLFVPIATPVRSARAVRDGAAVALRAVQGGIELTLPAQQPDEWDRVIELELQR